MLWSSKHSTNTCTPCSALERSRLSRRYLASSGSTSRFKYTSGDRYQSAMQINRCAPTTASTKLAKYSEPQPNSATSSAGHAAGA